MDHFFLWSICAAPLLLIAVHRCVFPACSCWLVCVVDDCVDWRSIDVDSQSDEWFCEKMVGGGWVTSVLSFVHRHRSPYSSLFSCQVSLLVDIVHRSCHRQVKGEY